MSSLVGSVVEREQRERELREMAFKDPLTGLANRALLDEQVQLSIARAQRSGERLALHFIDLNGFKPVNDRYGHAAGDEVLREIADRLRNAVRDQDVVARVGGDEFVVLETQISSVAPHSALASRLRAAFAAPIALSGDRSSTVGASIGVAYYPNDAANAHDLLQAADANMYAIKTAERLNHSMLREG